MRVLRVVLLDYGEDVEGKLEGECQQQGSGVAVGGNRAIRRGHRTTLDG